jgi:hypothetical protein
MVDQLYISWKGRSNLLTLANLAQSEGHTVRVVKQAWHTTLQEVTLVEAWERVEKSALKHLKGC